MEALQWISDGSSFSYGWLRNTNKNYDAADDAVPPFLDTTDSSSSMELNSEAIPVHWKTDSFEFACSRASALVHADQIISNGLLLPLHSFPPSKGEFSCFCRTTSVMGPLSVDSSKSMLSQSNRLKSRHCSVLIRPTPSNTSPASGRAQSLPASTRSGSYGNALERDTKANMIFLRECVKSTKKLFAKNVSFLRPFCVKKVKALVSSDKEVIHGECHGNKIADSGTEKDIRDAVLHCRNSFSKS